MDSRLIIRSTRKLKRHFLDAWPKKFSHLVFKGVSWRTFETWTCLHASFVTLRTCLIRVSVPTCASSISPIIRWVHYAALATCLDWKFLSWERIESKLFSWSPVWMIETSREVSMVCPTLNSLTSLAISFSTSMGCSIAHLKSWKFSMLQTTRLSRLSTWRSYVSSGNSTWVRIESDRSM